MRILVVLATFCLWAANAQNAQPKDPYAKPEPKPAPNANTKNLGDEPLLIHRPECKNEVQKYCQQMLVDVPKGQFLHDLGTLQCLQNAIFNDTEVQPACIQVIWDFKVRLTQDARYVEGFSHYCHQEIQTRPELAACAADLRPGYALSCLIDYVHTMHQETDCFVFLSRSAILAFGDFRLVGPFVQKCNKTVVDLGCGFIVDPTRSQPVRYPHSQGQVMDCIIKRLTNPPESAEIIKNIPLDCQHEITRIAELQSDDWHMYRSLFFACREDRERFCSGVKSGEGRVFQCLMEHKGDTLMNPKCAEVLTERAALMGTNFHISPRLVRGCMKELNAYGCEAQLGFEKAFNSHLSRVLICLEEGKRAFVSQQHDKKKLELEGKPVPQTPELMPMSDGCVNEITHHRIWLANEYRMSPELVTDCEEEVEKYCSSLGGLETSGMILHCLMGRAAMRDEKQSLSPKCVNAVRLLVKATDVDSDYRVDKVLYASCETVMREKCDMQKSTDGHIMACLMEHLKSRDMTGECERRLMEIQYFIAREWSLDSQLYMACHSEAVSRCSAVDNWNQKQQHKESIVDPGPHVLACLYRNAYDEQNPMSNECQFQVLRVLRERAERVSLLPDIESSCRDALAAVCTIDVRPEEEMVCLQTHFEQPDFRVNYPKCFDEIYKFTKMESTDTKLNRLLTRACRPVIATYCNELNEQEIDHGDVMTCLSQHKETPEMTPKCRSYVHHFELISLKDYNFNYRFTEACKPDIDNYCSAYGQDKGAIIRCLSGIMFVHRVLGDNKDLRKECKKQLRVAFLQQEHVDFEDKDKIRDADPTLMRECNADVARFQCKQKGSFEEVVECLREHFEELGGGCKDLVFQRLQVQAADNRFDAELHRICKNDIIRYCANQDGDRVLDCLGNTRVIRTLENQCQEVVKERLRERMEDDRLNPGLLSACKDEAQRYCPDEYNQVNNPQQAKDALGPLIANCLRAKYIQFRGQAHLGPRCKDEISNIILESEFDVTLDPKLYKACKNVINRHCSNTIITKGGNFDSVVECLKADLYTNQISDENCGRELVRRTQESLVDIHMDPSLHEACSTDILRLCRDVPPGQGRIITCLIEALDAPQANISPTCRTKLVERRKLWNLAHSYFRMELPEALSAVYNDISTHPQRNSILSGLGLVVLVLLLIGCCCGRITKRQYAELKNR